MKTPLDINGCRCTNWTWMQLYEASTSLNSHSPNSLATFKRNVQRMLELGPVDQEMTNEAKTRPVVGTPRGFVIYRITHNPSGKSYIGITENWDTREDSHSKARGNNPLHAAIRQYGWTAFNPEVVVNGSMTRTMARRTERAFILAENTLAPSGFNQRT